MPRDLRHIPPDSLVEVTLRTIEGRFYLRPDDACKEAVAGVFAWAVATHEMRIVAHVWLSNHAHILCVPRHAGHLSAFARDMACNTTKETNRLRNRRGPMWDGRYHSIVVSEEKEAQIARLRYLLANGVIKENLVATPQDWPGVSCVEHLLDGTPFEGTWTDRTKERKLRRGTEPPDPEDYTEKHSFHHVQLPCWANLPPEEYRQNIADLCDGITEEAREAREADEDRPRPLGVKQLKNTNPFSRPTSFTPTPRPRFHAIDGGQYRMLEEQYREFANRYRDAAQARLAGRSKPDFPAGSFPPALPFFAGRPPPHAAAATA